jgi:hypothetical protein
MLEKVFSNILGNGNKNIESFMLISEMQTCICGKISSQEAKKIKTTID